MAAVFEKTFIQDLTGRLIIRYCPEIVFGKDNLSNQINVKLYVGPNEYAGGGTVTATVIRSDGNTVPISGSISGNVVSVTLIEPCMDVPGQIQVFIRLTSGNVKTTIFAGVFTASRTETDTIIDPGTIIPSITELINQIDAAVDSIPADYSTLLGSVAGTYSASKTYAVGDYVWYDGALYRCTTAISTAESWTAAHWSRAVLGDDVTSLSSAFSRLEHPADNIVSELVYNQGAYYNNTGEYKTDSNWGYTDLIPAEPGKTYFINTPTTQYICFYDASSTFISGFAAFQATAPENTAYIRVSVAKPRQSVARLTINAPYYSYVDELKSTLTYPCAISCSGSININTVSKQFEIPGATIYSTLAKTYKSKDAQNVPYPTASQIVLYYDIVNDTYATATYTDYRLLDKYSNPWICLVSTGYTNSGITCVAKYTVNGLTTMKGDNTLSIAQRGADAVTVGLIHLWAIGDIAGQINIDTVARKITVPQGMFFRAGANNYSICSATELEWLAQGIELVCVNYTTNAYEILAYDVYRTKNVLNYGVVLVFNIGRTAYFASPFAVLKNGKDRNFDWEQFDYVTDKIGKKYSTSFNVTGSHSHSSNVLDVDISSGSTIALSAVFGNSATPSITWVLTDADGTTHNISSTGGSIAKHTPDYDVKKIGVYFPNVGSTSVDVSAQLYGDLQIFENKFICDNPGAINSVNGDGITKTCGYGAVGKKLYIPNASNDGPSANQQGAAYEDGKMIIATSSMSSPNTNCTLDVWDFETQTRLYTFPVPNDRIKHANNVIATGVKIDESDVCSLLMVSDNVDTLCVCRLTSTGCTVIHEIQFDTSITGYMPNFMLNDLNETIVSLGYTKNSAVDPNDNPMIVCVWDVTGWDAEGGTPTVSLRYKYTLPHMEIMNGGIIRNGIMYIMCTPFQFHDYTFIAVSPIEAKTITNRWHFTQKAEYENINFVDDKTIIYGAYWFYKVKLKTVILSGGE